MIPFVLVSVCVCVLLRVRVCVCVCVYDVKYIKQKVYEWRISDFLPFVEEIYDLYYLLFHRLKHRLVFVGRILN